MCKIFSVIILLCILLRPVEAEYNVATGRDEMVLIGNYKEVSMGRSIAQQVEKQFPLVSDQRIINRVNAIGKRLVDVCDRQDIDYYFRVLDKDMVNAFAVPGGYIYVFKGLIDKITTDDQLASVIGHEIGHIVCKHSVKRMQTSYLYSALRVIAALQPDQDSSFGEGMDLAYASILTEYSQEDEFMADKLGVIYSEKAGYDPMGAIEFLEIMKQVQKEEPTHPYSYWRTHPYIDERIRQVRIQITGQMTFDDYIN